MISHHVIDPDLWSKAGWRRVALLEDEPQCPLPVVALVFHDLDAGRAIFQDWRDRFGWRYAGGHLRVTFVKGKGRGWRPGFVLSIGPSGYLSTKPPSDLAFYSRAPNLKTFQRRVRETKKYDLVPALLEEEHDLSLDPGYLLRLQSPKFRNAPSIREGDRDAATLDFLRLPSPEE